MRLKKLGVKVLYVATICVNLMGFIVDFVYPMHLNPNVCRPIHEVP